MMASNDAIGYGAGQTCLDITIVVTWSRKSLAVLVNRREAVEKHSIKVIRSVSDVFFQCRSLATLYSVDVGPLPIGPIRELFRLYE